MKSSPSWLPVKLCISCISVDIIQESKSKMKTKHTETSNIEHYTGYQYTTISHNIIGVKHYWGKTINCGNWSSLASCIILKNCISGETKRVKFPL